MARPERGQGVVKMDFNASQRLANVVCEVKEAKLKALMARALSWRNNLPSGCELADITMIAKSPESPVARALAASAADFAQYGIAVRVLLSELEPGFVPLPEGRSILDIQTGAIRALTDPRLVEVHEQLVIGTVFTWIGDCMRRDPLKRDALETYDGTDPQRIACARVSFERLWAKGKVMPRVTTQATASAVVAGLANRVDEHGGASRR